MENVRKHKYGSLIHQTKQPFYHNWIVISGIIVTFASIQLSNQVFIAWKNTSSSGTNYYFFFAWLIIDIVCICLLIAIIIASFNLQKVQIFEEGIIPSWRPWKMVLLRIDYFIPFQEIQKIGIFLNNDLENANKLWFFMKNGTLAECEYAGLENEVLPILVPLLRTKSSNAELVPIIIKNNKLDFSGFDRFSSIHKYHTYIPQINDDY
jgi:hypothetical protein